VIEQRFLFEAIEVIIGIAGRRQSAGGGDVAIGTLQGLEEAVVEQVSSHAEIRVLDFKFTRPVGAEPWPVLPRDARGISGTS